MARNARLLVTCTLLVLMGLQTGCAMFSSRRPSEEGEIIPHSAYGGCRLQGRHFHNTHVFIGDYYSPSLTEWTRY